MKGVDDSESPSTPLGQDPDLTIKGTKEGFWKGKERENEKIG